MQHSIFSIGTMSWQQVYIMTVKLTIMQFEISNVYPIKYTQKTITCTHLNVK